MKMEPIVSSETSAIRTQTPGNYPKRNNLHVESYSKNKFEKLVHLIGFIIRTYYDARSPERQVLPSELLSHEAVCCVIDVCVSEVFLCPVHFVSVYCELLPKTDLFCILVCCQNLCQ